MTAQADRLLARLANRDAEIAKLQRIIQRQRTDIGNKDRQIEALAEKDRTARRILRNALDDAIGWHGEARAAIDTRPQRAKGAVA